MLPKQLLFRQIVDHFYRCEDYELRRSVGYLARELGGRVTSCVEALFVEKDLTFIQYAVLMNLRDGLANTCVGLRQHLRHDSGALTRVIDQLEERKFLRRERSTDDRRIVTLHLTPLGRRTVESLLPLVVALYNEWLADFTSDEAETLLRLMGKLSGRIAAQEP